MEIKLDGLELPDNIIRGWVEGRDVRKAVLAELTQRAKDALQECTPHEILSEWRSQSVREGVLLQSTYDVLDAARDGAEKLLRYSDLGPILRGVEIQPPVRINVDPKGISFRTAVVVGILTTLDDWMDDTIVVALLTEPLDGAKDGVAA